MRGRWHLESNWDDLYVELEETTVDLVTVRRVAGEHQLRLFGMGAISFAESSGRELALSIRLAADVA